MEKWRCTACNYIYDPAKGDPDNGVVRQRMGMARAGW